MLTRIHFTQLDGGVPLLTCRLEGLEDSLHIILDTGSSGVSLDSSFCARAGIDTKPSDTNVTGISGSQKTRFVFNKKLVLETLQTGPLNFHVYDYSALSSVYGERIDGVLGFPFLSKYIICLDYDSLIMSCFSNGPIHYPQNGLLLTPRINPLPLQQCGVKNVKKREMNFFMDSGAGLGILFNETFARDSGMLSDKKKLYPTRAEGYGGSSPMKLTVLRELKLGNYRFKNVPLYVFSDVENVTHYPVSGGLLGNEILRRFNMVFYFDNNEIFLKPNSHFDEPFDYGYSGLSLHLVQDKIVVDDVLQDSPAGRAGIKKGDIIVSIENNFSGNLRQYRSYLQAAHNTLGVILKRDSFLIETKITLENINE